MSSRKMVECAIRVHPKRRTCIDDDDDEDHDHGDEHEHEHASEIE